MDGLLNEGLDGGVGWVNQFYIESTLIYCLLFCNRSPDNATVDEHHRHM